MNGLSPMYALLMALAVGFAIYVAGVAALLLAGRRTAAKEMALLVPNLVLLFKDLARDPRVPRGSKTLVLVGVLWLASPIDLIPEFVPLLGPLDDAVVAALILRHLLRVAGPEVIEEHWSGEPATLTRLLRLAARRGGTTPSVDEPT